MDARRCVFLLSWHCHFFVLAIGMLIQQSVFAISSPQLILDTKNAEIQQPLATKSFTGIEAFVDRLVKNEIEKHGLPGVTISVVKDGEIVLLKGYGFADLNKQSKVDPQYSLFRVASITKTMTAIAVMQLVEQGKLGLDVDVNQYLSSFKIPQTFSEPITIRSLLSHRAGFEVADAGNLFVVNPLQVDSTEEYLATHMPKRIWPPGLNVSYSNYGFGLLGYIVEQKSGMDLATYMDLNIFSKLGMQNTTLREPKASNSGNIPMHAELEQQLAKGYFRYGKDDNREKSFEFMGHIGGAGGVSSTAYDMALYMISSLNDYKHPEGRLVNLATSKAMKQRLYNDRPLATGIAHGMFDGIFKGHHKLSHTGGTPTFLSNMVMFTELNLGIFVSTNIGGSRSSIIESLPNSILNNYYRRKPPKPAESINNQFLQAAFGQQSLENYTGVWLHTRRSYTQLEKLSVLNKSVNISLDGGGDLIMTSDNNRLKLKKLKTGVFQGLSREAPIFYFYQDDKGNINRFSASMWSADYERIGFVQSPLYFYITLAICAIFSLTTLLLNFIRSRKLKSLSIVEKLASYSGGVVLTVILGFILINSRSVFDDYALNINFPTIHVKFLLCLVIIVVLTTLAKVISLPFMWRISDMRLLVKLHYLVFTISCLNFLMCFGCGMRLGLIILVKVIMKQKLVPEAGLNHHAL